MTIAESSRAEIMKVDPLTGKIVKKFGSPIYKTKVVVSIMALQ
jgi:hypothetical protein